MPTSKPATLPLPLMIPWLLDSAQNLPASPETFLNAAEIEKLAAFRFAKRRNDWLLGRWTAKQLLQAVILKQHDQRVETAAIEILNDANGAPYAVLQGNRLPIQFSISHSQHLALCAAVPFHPVDEPQMCLGADLEFIEPRAESLVRDFFTANEQRRVETAPPALHDIVVTLIWSAKEAVLKAQHTGLSIDTRIVEISIAPFERATAEWSLFDATWRVGDPAGHPLYGWWCVREGFILTLAATTRDTPTPLPLCVKIPDSLRST